MVAKKFWARVEAFLKAGQYFCNGDSVFVKIGTDSRVALGTKGDCLVYGRLFGDDGRVYPPEHIRSIVKSILEKEAV